MNRTVTAITLATALGFVLAQPATAQIQAHDAVAAECARGGDCEALVAAAIEQWRQEVSSQEELDERLGLLAGALADRAVGLPMTFRYSIAAALRSIGQASSDGGQSTAVASFADELEGRTGRAGLSVGPFGSASEA